jgi:hypothetical protein
MAMLHTAATRWTLFYVANACLFIECVVGALGAALFFRAFEQALQPTRIRSSASTSLDHQASDR